MKLYYDRISKMYSISGDEETRFLGPITNTLLLLQTDFNMSEIQAREAVLNSTMNGGLPVDIDRLRKLALKESKYFRKEE